MGYKRVPISRGMPRRGFEGGDLDLSSSRQMGHSYVFLGGSNYIKRLVTGGEEPLYQLNSVLQGKNFHFFFR
jgi:hypothetical protein